MDLALESILIERMNQRLNGFSGYAKIWGVVVLDHPWTIESVEIQAWAQEEPTPEGRRQVCSALITMSRSMINAALDA